MSRETARKVLEIESEAIRELIPRLDASFDRAVDVLLATSGRVVGCVASRSERSTAGEATFKNVEMTIKIWKEWRAFSLVEMLEKATGFEAKQDRPGGWGQGSRVG